VAFLLERFKSEIDINRRNVFGFTAVMKAALQGRIKCLRSLLSAGQLFFPSTHLFTPFVDQLNHSSFHFLQLQEQMLL
jgi:ankyrin repeat protein